MGPCESDEESTCTTEDTRSFPVSRYAYCDFRAYYAFGNSPPEDFLQGCVGKKHPSILILGCGDMRSCFYTLWKNFGSNSASKFSGIDFVLNDWSTPLLARNIVFIFLCLQLPSSAVDRKKWLSAMWSIWYCHELYPQHLKMLDDSLESLLKYSESLSAWEHSDNPLCNLVRFTSSRILTEISKVWKLWLEDKDMTLGDMHLERNMMLQRSDVSNRMDSYTSDPSVVLNKILNDDAASIETYEIPEVRSYVESGNCYAEDVFDITLCSYCVRTSNATLFERKDGMYSLEWWSLPFRSYHLTTKISPDGTKQEGVGELVCDSIRSEHFLSRPFLATCVQQFCMWVQSASAVLNEEVFEFSFTLNNHSALVFCQDQQQSGGFLFHFDAIFSSNLVDHLGPPNLLLSALPMLKAEGSLFMTTYQFTDYFHTAEDYLMLCFGFECELIPTILGVHCVIHDGVKYDAPSNVLKLLNRAHKILTWSKISLQKTKAVTNLPAFEVGNLTDGLLKSVAASAAALMPVSVSDSAHYLCKQLVVSNNNTETVMQELQNFKALANAGDDDYQFWEPFSTGLCTFLVFKPYQHSLHTQAILHGLHMHINGFSCPMCMHIPTDEYLGLFCAELSLPLEIPHTYSNFMALIHSSPTLPVKNIQRMSLMELCTENISVIDSFDGVVVGKKLRLNFFAPLDFIADDLNVTIARFILREEGGNLVKIALSATKIEDLKIDFEEYVFSCVPVDSHLYHSADCDPCDPDIAESESEMPAETSFEQSDKKTEPMIKTHLENGCIEPPKMKCNFCNRSGHLKMCKRCKKAGYCDRECQAKHWPMHKKTCRMSAMTEAARKLLQSPLPVIVRCAYCDCFLVSLKACTRCKKVKYCGKECQKKHWKDHKDACM